MALFNLSAQRRVIGVAVLLSFSILSVSQARGIKSQSRLPTKISHSNKTPLILNGSKTRYVWGFEVYKAGLYLKNKCACEKTIMLKNRDEKRVHIKMLRDVTSDKFTESIQESINGNFSTTERKKFSGEIKSFIGSLSIFGELKKGTDVTFDYLPKEGTQIAVNGKKAKIIPGDEFYHKILSLWIGNPNQASMKPGLLGKK